LTPADADASGRWVSVGKVGRPHGLAGGFVVEQASDDPARFAEGATVYAAREEATVVESKRSGGRLVVRLDRDVPRGAPLELPASELPPAAEDEFYVYELVGLTVVVRDGPEVGRVRDVAAGVANDVLELESGVTLPMVEDCVLAVDLDGGRIVIAPEFAPES
jgi:16S rRNA processing protein RimM